MFIAILILNGIIFDKYTYDDILNYHRRRLFNFCYVVDISLIYGERTV